ncbi:hypothetical protein [Mycobacterium asiaticum]|nr:hypothetical protein [Mycobacterium asiaticum]
MAKLRGRRVAITGGAQALERFYTTLPAPVVDAGGVVSGAHRR